MSIALNTKVGDRELCAWQPVHGVTWVQTREPRHARRLARRSDGRVVAHSVAGGYLRTFEFPHTLAWALRLIARYTADVMTANEGLNGEFRPPANRGRAPAMGTADREVPAVSEAFRPPDRTARGRPALCRRERAGAADGGDPSSGTAATHESRHLAGDAGCLAPRPVGGRKSPL
jgi:hypothetical protein